MTCLPALINKTVILFYYTHIVINDRSANKLKHKLQLTINYIMLWVVSANKFTINIDKTQCMSCRNDIEFYIVIENKYLVQVYETKFLWLIIDSSLNWKSHFKFLKNKLLKIYWIIKNVSFCLNESAMIKLYYSLFYHQLIYCLEIWGNAYKSYINCIHVIQKKVLKLVFSKPIDFSSKKLFKDHKLLNIFDLRKYKILICMHRIYYKTCSPCIYKHYKRINKKKIIQEVFLFHTTL